MRGLDTLALTARLAWRNVRLQRGKSLLVGGIFLFGALMVVLSNALVDAMDKGMTRSITQSLAGHLQIYDADAKDKLALYGDQFAGTPDFGQIAQFHETAQIIRAIPGVRAVVPLGAQIAMVARGNEMDRRLSQLRNLVDPQAKPTAAEQAAVPEGAEALPYRIEQVRYLIELLADDLALAGALIDESEEAREQQRSVQRAQTDAFWQEFQADPLPALEFLENKIAPLDAESGFIGMWFMGTDPAAFAEAFPRFEIVLGEPLPQGQRGFLFNHGFYEEAVKNPIARELDHLMRAAEQGQLMADDAELRARARRAQDQYRRIQFQLDPQGTAQLTAGLQTLLGAQEPALKSEADLSKLLQAFLQIDDNNIKTRHAWFYEHIAPLIELYAIPVGQTITVQSFTKAGYPRALNLKVYGTFQFSGLERSTISKVHNLIDMISFRDLYGDTTPEKTAELAALREAVGARDVTAEEAEDALFGEAADPELPDPTLADAPAQVEGDPGDRPASEDDLQGVLADLAALDLSAAARITADHYDPQIIEQGLALNAAIILEDERPENIAAKKQEIQAALDAAGQRIQVVDWQEAAGLIGQLVLVVRVILAIVFLILAVVSLVIINNSMVMATLERLKEVGTMRAIGAPRRFVTQLLMGETLVLSLVAGGLGALLGGVIVLWLGATGIASRNEFMTFLFSGSHLRPELSIPQMLFAIGLVVVVGVLSTFYPARLAARVNPAQAMGAGDGT